ncbi:MAG TPA: nucleotidyltransferase family protein [Chthoniobacterales bacterium]|nr:nucleotidyltransferase family protein [Chthoniobacterales bacterium]
MKAILLAAGHGTRMRPLTDSIPKCLLRIQGVPLLEIWLDLCRRHSIDEILINTHAHADLVREFVGGYNGGIEICVSEEPLLLGSAGTLLKNRAWLSADSPFWVFYSDVLTNVNLERMLEHHNTCSQVATLGVCEVPDPKRCGIVTVDKKNVVSEFVEKPHEPSSNLAFSGIIVSEPSLLDFIPNHIPVDLGSHVLPKLVGRMAAYRISDYLLDVGTQENYRAAQASWPGNSKTTEARQC